MTATVATVGAASPPLQSAAWRRLRRDRASMLGLVGVVIFIVIGLVGPILSPYGPLEVNVKDRFLPPSTTYFFGTDQFGRDLFWRVIVGTRVSLLVAFLATGISVVAGVLIGAVSGFFGGWTDEVSMRGLDIVLAFPSIVLAIALAAVLGSSLENVILIIGVLGIPQFARVTRGAVLMVKNADFVVAARVIGQGELRILAEHIIPNTIGPILVLASLAVPGAIIAEAALSFLGLGIHPPTPSWGNLLADGRQYLLQAPWLATFPGLAITLAALAFNFVGDGLRDALDPRSTR
jgi:peptide/nickel transport system permease protein